MVLYAVSKASIGLPIAHNDDVDATGTSGSLATTAPGVVHLVVVGGMIVVELAVAESAPGTPWWEWVSCNVAFLLTIYQGHVQGLYRGGPVVV